MHPSALASILGLLVGCVCFAAVVLSGLAAARLRQENQLLELIIRVIIFGAITLTTAELVGHYFAPLIRAQVLWFWGSFAVGFIAVPYAVLWLLRRNQSPT